MRHDNLWAPWRLSYVAGKEPRPETTLRLRPGGDSGCFLCRAAASDRGRDHLIVAHSDATFVLLNRFPYNNGHLLIAPLRHVGRIDELTADETAECQQSIVDFVSRLEKLMNADGFNIGLNLGRAAGAGVPGHLHWHVLPRWNGDTNFMATLAGVEVIPQALEALWETLTAAPPAPVAASNAGPDAGGSSS